MNTYKDDTPWTSGLHLFRRLHQPDLRLPQPSRCGKWTKPLQGSFHDLEIGRDGKVYAVNISRHRMIALDPDSGKQTTIEFPPRVYAPHSIETANDGSLWTTMCASGQMVRYDIETKEFETSTAAPRHPETRGNYPTHVADQSQRSRGTDLVHGCRFELLLSRCIPTHVVKEYKLLSAGQAIGAGRGESRGITPYGLDYSPIDGMIWYSKLNGNRIGRIDPERRTTATSRNGTRRSVAARRLHVAPDGMVWVPGFGSGVFGKFDPNTEDTGRSTNCRTPRIKFPMRLNVDKDGIVWICGTGNDTINRFDPKSETLVEFRLPNPSLLHARNRIRRRRQRLDQHVRTGPAHGTRSRCGYPNLTAGHAADNRRYQTGSQNLRRRPRRRQPRHRSGNEKAGETQ